jgi:hypothetical protein
MASKAYFRLFSIIISLSILKYFILGFYFTILDFSHYFKQFKIILDYYILGYSREYSTIMGHSILNYFNLFYNKYSKLFIVI